MRRHERERIPMMEERNLALFYRSNKICPNDFQIIASLDNASKQHSGFLKINPLSLWCNLQLYITLVS